MPARYISSLLTSLLLYTLQAAGDFFMTLIPCHVGFE
jgi:hypothetical protein